MLLLKSYERLGVIEEALLETWEGSFIVSLASGDNKRPKQLVPLFLSKKGMATLSLMLLLFDNTNQSQRKCTNSTTRHKPKQAAVLESMRRQSWGRGGRSGSVTRSGWGGVSEKFSSAFTTPGFLTEVGTREGEGLAAPLPWETVRWSGGTPPWGLALPV